MEQITVWKTSDGKIHYSEDKATLHDLDRIQGIIGERLDKASDGRLTKSEVLSIMIKLIPDLKTANEIIKDLNKI